MTSNPRCSEHGYALIAVVGIVGVLAVIAMALTERARVGASAASEFLEETRDLYAAQAGIALAERAMAGKPDMGKDGQLRLKLTWDDRHLDILITDQTRKIDVNRASQQQLAEGFAALGFSAEEAAALAVRTIDWRDPDDWPHPRGAEAAEYLAAGLKFQPRNDRFVSLDEVDTLPGVSPDSAELLRDQFAITRRPGPVASGPATSPNVMEQEEAQSDGLTRRSDDPAGARDFGTKIRVRRNGKKVEYIYFSVLLN